MLSILPRCQSGKYDRTEWMWNFVSNCTNRQMTKHPSMEWRSKNSSSKKKPKMSKSKIKAMLICFFDIRDIINFELVHSMWRCWKGLLMPWSVEIVHGFFIFSLKFFSTIRNLHPIPTDKLSWLGSSWLWLFPKLKNVLKKSF